MPVELVYSFYLLLQSSVLMRKNCYNLKMMVTVDVIYPRQEVNFHFLAVAISSIWFFLTDPCNFVVIGIKNCSSNQKILLNSSWNLLRKYLFCLSIDLFIVHKWHALVLNFNTVILSEIGFQSTRHVIERNFQSSFTYDVGV